MRTLVVGAGRMGHGIALCYALGGHGVDLVDTDEGGFARARAAIGAAAALLADNELRTSTEVEQAIERIHFGTDLAAAAAQAGLVEEAIPEDLPAKQRLLEEIESTAPDEAMLATNTSSLRIGAIGARMTHPERLIGIHWVAPPYLVPTVEIVRTPTTPVELVDRAKQMLIGLGKVPVVVPDVAGFAVNRLQYALFAAATDLVEQGILEPAEVDQV
ncbi:MAG TPA: 3-hydroxyacyl-CoA dehydrogenase family protein, partial [Candidatus Limnocylindrales bacterium]|nr:3-hydroxyacyl-CoA dehydrogenase family protein [Candidatus Limnocylindrales bacterium]